MISQFFKDFILTIIDTLAHFTVNWVLYVMHANKVAFTILLRLIQQNTYEQYVSTKEDALQTAIENSDKFIIFFTHICKHLQNVDLSILHTNIKQMSDTLSMIVLNVVQVLPQFRGKHKHLCKICHSSDHFDNQCPNKATHQQQIDEYTYFPSI
jgi:hypothetical protein